MARQTFRIVVGSVLHERLVAIVASDAADARIFLVVARAASKPVRREPVRRDPVDPREHALSECHVAGPARIGLLIRAHSLQARNRRLL